MLPLEYSASVPSTSRERRKTGHLWESPTTALTTLNRPQTSIASYNVKKMSSTTVHTPKKYIQNSDDSRIMARASVEGMGSSLVPITKSAIDRRRPSITSTNTTLISHLSVSRSTTVGFNREMSSSGSEIQVLSVARAPSVSSSRSLTSRDSNSTVSHISQKAVLSGREAMQKNHLMWKKSTEKRHRPMQKIYSKAPMKSSLAEQKKVSPPSHPGTQPFSFKEAERFIANTPETKQEPSLDKDSVIENLSPRYGTTGASSHCPAVLNVRSHTEKSRKHNLPLSPVHDTILDKNYILDETHKSNGELQRAEVEETPEPELNLNKVFGLRSELRQDRGLRKELTTKGIENSPREFSSLIQDRGPWEKLTVQEIESSLREFDKTMRDDHAATLNILLQDSRIASGGTSLFVDTNDAFASMPSLQRETQSGSATKEAYQLIETTLPQNGANAKGAQLSTIAATSYETDLEDCRTPVHRAYVNIKQNFLVEDNNKLDFIPFFLADEDDKKQEILLYKNLRESYPDYDDYVHKSHIPHERQNRLFARLPHWLAVLRVQCTQRDLEQFILSKDTSLCQMLLHKKNQQSFGKRFGIPLDRDVEKAAEDFSTAFEQVFMPLKDVVFTRLRRDQLAVPDKKTDRKSLHCPAKGGDLLGSISTYTSTCLICSAIMCPTHGEYEYYDHYTNDMNMIGDYAPHRPEAHLRSIEIYSDELLRSYYKRLADSDREPDNKTDDVATPQEACSSECRLQPRARSEDEIMLSTKDIKDIHCCLIAIRSVQRRSCDIARGLQIPCWKVFEEIKRYIEQGGDEVPANLSEANDGHGVPCSWYDNKRHRILKEPWGRYSNMEPEKRGQFEPCDHPGSCTAECICVRNGVLCEDACLCPVNCPHRYTGCACKYLKGKCCTTESCLCKQLVRECGPQCGSCGAHERLNHSNSHRYELHTQGCQNVKIQSEAEKRLVVGQSEIDVSPPFLGCFAAEPITKGSYIAEYKGEIVSHDESERRAAIYDFKRYSFLFQLNEYFTVDAINFGNKTRYINHAFHDTGRVNCQQTVWWVNGEMRITFTAVKDIAAGEELYFDYGEDFAKAHGFSRLPGGKAGSSKGKRRKGYTAKKTITATKPKSLKKRKLVLEEKPEEMEKRAEILELDTSLTPFMLDHYEDEDYDGEEAEVSELDDDEKVRHDGRSVSKELGILEETLRGNVENGGRGKRNIRKVVKYTR